MSCNHILYIMHVYIYITAECSYLIQRFNSSFAKKKKLRTDLNNLNQPRNLTFLEIRIVNSKLFDR